MNTGILNLLVLAVGVVASASCAFAHPLPDSKLTFAVDTTKLELTLEIPVPELIIAQPTLSKLEDVKKTTDIPFPIKNELAAYVQQHLSITPIGQSPLKPQLISAQVLEAHTEYVNQYDLLIVQMSAVLPANRQLFPAKLTYDVVLHEVRNHSAIVWFASPDKTPVRMGKIRFDAALGLTRPLELTEIP